MSDGPSEVDVWPTGRAGRSLMLIDETFHRQRGWDKAEQRLFPRERDSYWDNEENNTTFPTR